MINLNRLILWATVTVDGRILKCCPLPTNGNWSTTSKQRQCLVAIRSLVDEYLSLTDLSTNDFIPNYLWSALYSIIWSNPRNTAILLVAELTPNSSQTHQLIQGLNWRKAGQSLSSTQLNFRGGRHVNRMLLLLLSRLKSLSLIQARR